VNDLCYPRTCGLCDGCAVCGLSRQSNIISATPKAVDQCLKRLISPPPELAWTLMEGKNDPCNLPEEISLSIACRHRFMRTCFSSSSFWAPRFVQVREGLVVPYLYLTRLSFIIFTSIITSVLLQFLKYHRLVVEPDRGCSQPLSREQGPRPLPGPENAVRV
jgi:hypothetical protein